MSLTATIGPIVTPDAADLQAAFARVDAELAAIGLSATVHHRLDGFDDLPIERDIPTYRGFLEGSGQFLTVERDGGIVATFAAQPLVLADTLTAHLEIEGLYPQPWADADGNLVAEQWMVDRPARDITDAIRGLAVFTGGIWLRPDLRRSAGGDTAVHDLLIEGALLGRMGRAVAVAKTGAEHLFYFTKAGRAVAERFRPEIGPLAGIRWLRNGRDIGPRVMGYISAGFVRERL